MSYRLARLLQKTTGMLLLLVFGLIGWMAACNPAVAEAPATQTQSYTFYLFDSIEWNRLAPLDPETLNNQPDGKTLEQGILSADGSTAVDMEYPEGRASPDPEDIWIVVYDLQSRAERNRFHPPARVLVSDLSEDGARLLLQPDPNTYSPSSYPPIAEWYVVDTTSGEVLAHVKDADNSCFGQRAQFDPAGQRIYCVVDPAITGADEPEPMQVVAYNIESGVKAGVLELPEVLIGGSGTELNGQSVEEFLEPAVELSPDGQRLAIVHADANKITLLDARNLTIERTFSLERSLSLLDLFAPAVAYAKGEMTGTIRQAEFSLDGQYLYVFTQEVRLAAGQEPPEKRGLWLVDLEQDVIMAEALTEYQIQWVRPALDGTVYIFGTTDERLFPYEIRTTSPSMLWRMDGLTLELLAERAFTGYRGGRLVIEGPAAIS